jgi:hypothetical protein
MRRIWLALGIPLAATFCTSSVFAAGPADEGFRKLSGAEIRKTFIGKTFSDQVHFTERYRADGTIEGVSIGAKSSGTWRIVKDELCITNHFGEFCYAVWKKGSEARLVYKKSEIDGYIE